MRDEEEAEAAAEGSTPTTLTSQRTQNAVFVVSTNHKEQQWRRKNPHLRPRANMAKIQEAGVATDREWEAEHKARERRQRSLEEERERREEATDDLHGSQRRDAAHFCVNN